MLTFASNGYLTSTFIMGVCKLLTRTVGATYTCAVDLHLEFIKVKPVLGLLWIQVMVEISCCKPKTVEPQIRSEQQTRWALLIGHSGVTALPTSAQSRAKLSFRVKRKGEL